MDVLSPTTMRELRECLGKLGPGAVIAGGCTDISVRLLTQPRPPLLLDITHIPELGAIYIEDNCLKIGAAVTLSQLDGFELPESLYALKQAAAGVGSKQIRNAATIGGNVMNASPAGDLLPCLFMLGARVKFIGPVGIQEERPIEEIVIGAGQTSLGYNEALISVDIPIPPVGTRTAFVKLGYRRSVTVARINIAMALPPGGKVRCCLGAVSGIPVDVPEAEFDEEKLFLRLSALLEKIVPEEFDRDYKKVAVRGAVCDIIRMLGGPDE